VEGFVFISYSRADVGYARRMAAHLRQAGVPVWLDTEQVGYGDRWESLVRDQVDACAAMLVIMSPAAEESRHVGNEVARALKRHKPMLPVLLAGEEFYALGSYHRFDARDARLPGQDFLDRAAVLAAAPPPADRWIGAIRRGLVLTHRYRLDQHLADGEFGAVWRAADVRLDRTVAVKIIPPELVDDPMAAARFERETRAMARVILPGVAQIYDAGTDQGLTFMIMEYVDGEPLSLLRHRAGRLAPARTMDLVARVADILVGLHRAGLRHGNLTPANVLVRPDEGVVLAAFEAPGIDFRHPATYHLSPEQAVGGIATAHSDIYSLGVIAYECLAGVRPFEGDTPPAVAMQHVRDAPPPLPVDVPAAVREVVAQAMAKDPADRPTAVTLAQAARRAAAHRGQGTVSGSP
jgi:hypothetical protein